MFQVLLLLLASAPLEDEISWVLWTAKHQIRLHSPSFEDLNKYTPSGNEVPKMAYYFCTCISVCIIQLCAISLLRRAQMALLKFSSFNWVS